jgi:lipopolysaccharide export system protein LptA
MSFQKLGFSMTGLTMKHSILKNAFLIALTAGFSAVLFTSNASSAISPDPNTLRITADKQSYNVESKRSFLSGRVSVAYQDIRITGPRAEVEMDANGKPEVARFFERPMVRRVKPNVGEDRVTGDVINIYIADDRFGAKGNVESNIATAAADPFYIRSDIQEFDNRNKVMAASGNVQVNYQGSQAFSSLANVRMKDNGKAERVIFSGGARIKKQASEINGDKVTVMVDSGNLIAEHNVKTRVDLKSQQQNGPTQVVITSDYQQYDKATDTMIASGNVKILYDDYVAVGPKATFKLKENDVDRIFLTGRPTITENGRVITADKITITTNPKNFDAVGNVKVSFKSKSAQPAASAPSAAKKQVSGKPLKPTHSLQADDPSDY